MTPEQRTARAEKGGLALKEKYGRDFFVHMRSFSHGRVGKRGKRKIPVVTPEMLGLHSGNGNNIGTR